MCRTLAASGHEVRAVSRRPSGEPLPEEALGLPVEWRRVDDPLAEPDWARELHGIEGVVHLGARVHRMAEDARGAQAAYLRENVGTTVALARAAAASGVERFVFMSTVKVHGEHSPREPDGQWHRFTETETPRPVDPYAQSKWAAEQALRAETLASRLPCVVLRPPLVYGPGVGANFLALLRAVHLGIPLPLGAIDNLRSLVAVDNLAELVETCLTHPRAPGKTFLVSDFDVSTPALIRGLGEAMDVRPRLFALPPAVLRASGALLGRRAAVERLAQSLVVDAARLIESLGWRPSVSSQRALSETAQWYLGRVRAAG